MRWQGSLFYYRQIWICIEIEGPFTNSFILNFVTHLDDHGNLSGYDYRILTFFFSVNVCIWLSSFYLYRRYKNFRIMTLPHPEYRPQSFSCILNLKPIVPLFPVKPEGDRLPHGRGCACFWSLSFGQVVDRIPSETSMMDSRLPMSGMTEKKKYQGIKYVIPAGC